MKRPSRRALVVVGAVVLAAAVYLLGRGGGISVSTAAAARDSLTVTIRVEGRTRARELYTVTAPIGGLLSRLSVEQGDTVRQGDVLGRIRPAREDPRTLAALRAEVEAARGGRSEAESRVAQAEVRAAQARREVERRRPLAEMGALSAEAMEQVVAAAEVAERDLDAARSALAAAEARLESAEARLIGAGPGDGEGPAVDLVAPVTGRVVGISDRSERIVGAGAPLLELADSDGIEIVIDVLSEDAVAIEPGQELVIDDWGGRHPFRGTVRTVTRAGYTEVSALGVEEQRVDVIADPLDLPDALGTGYRVAGEIVVWRGADVLSVPSSAVFSGTGGWQVFVVEDGTARLRGVRIGRQGRDRVEILEGLEEGAQVVVFPPGELEDGAGVEVEPAVRAT